MLLCLDVGNTHILGGIFSDQQLVARFRCATHLIGTADQFGTFLLSILQANHLAPEKIKASAICSVVPGCDYTINHTISQYFGHNAFMLRGSTKMELIIKSHDPNEVGADLIAGSIGAIAAFPQKHLLIVDMGTATTVCAVTKQREYLGVSIIPGMRLSMESLRSNTAKLMEVNLEIPNTYIGRRTWESIQSGLFYGQLGALREIIAGMKKEAFANEEVVVIGTGGFARLFKDTNLFHTLMPDLVLQGILKAYEYATQ
jgi:type III pantothenate kinase